MDVIRSALEPITSLLPEGLREAAVWILLALLALLTLGVLSILLRAVLGKKRKPAGAWEKEVIDLETCPLPPAAPGAERLTVFSAPCRLRLVVVAPVGRDRTITAPMVEKLLDAIVPGLGSTIRADRPLLRIWPPQLSHEGFSNTFHRCTIKRERDHELSRWILVAGKGMVGKQPVLVGLGAWADEPSAVGRKSLDSESWLDRVRVENRKG